METGRSGKDYKPVGKPGLHPVVMLVDDNEADLLFTRIVLERSGQPWDVRSFEAARDALDYLREAGAESVDLILLDINMPAMNGFEFLEAYEHSLGDRPWRPVVVMLSSSPDPADRARAARYASVRGYMTKPIDLETARGLLRYLH